MNSKEANEKFAAYCHTLGVPCEVKPLGKQANIPDEVFWGGSPNDATIHETANQNPGAGAEMHWRFVKNGGGDGLASFNITADKLGVIVIVSHTPNGIRVLRTLRSPPAAVFCVVR